MAYIQVSAEYLAHKGCQTIAKELDSLLQEFCSTDAGWFSPPKVARIDLAIDFVSNLCMESWIGMRGSRTPRRSIRTLWIARSPAGPWDSVGP